MSEGEKSGIENLAEEIHSLREDHLRAASARRWLPWLPMVIALIAIGGHWASIQHQHELLGDHLTTSEIHQSIPAKRNTGAG